MKLDDVIADLQKLQAQGHGSKQVFGMHGASGVPYELGSAHITNCVGDTGPFDLEPNEEYVSIYLGN